MDSILSYKKPDRKARIEELEDSRTDKSETSKSFYHFIQSYDQFGRYYPWREKIFGCKMLVLIIFITVVVTSNLLLLGNDVMQYSQEHHVKYLNFESRKML